MKDLDLLRLHINALFVQDDNGKLLRINELDAENPAPRFFLGRTTQGNLWRTRHDLPAPLSTEIERLAADEPVVGDLRQPPKHAAAYAHLLGQHALIQSTEAGPAYYLPELASPSQVVKIMPENRFLLRKYFSYLHDHLDEYVPIVVKVVEGIAVAACFSSRLIPQAAEAGLYTEEPYRRRGYAAPMVSGWAAGVRASGRLPLYSTSWENTASQAVAGKLGAVLYATDFSIT